MRESGPSLSLFFEREGWTTTLNYESVVKIAHLRLYHGLRPQLLTCTRVLDPALISSHALDVRLTSNRYGNPQTRAEFSQSTYWKPIYSIRGRFFDL